MEGGGGVYVTIRMSSATNLPSTLKSISLIPYYYE